MENPETLGFKIANKIILVKVRDALGLSRCDLNLSGAAPISADILKFFMSLNIVVTEVCTIYVICIMLSLKLETLVKLHILIQRHRYILGTSIFLRLMV